MAVHVYHSYMTLWNVNKSFIIISLDVNKIMNPYVYVTTGHNGALHGHGQDMLLFGMLLVVTIAPRACALPTMQKPRVRAR